MDSLQYPCVGETDASMKVILSILVLFSIPLLTGCIDLSLKLQEDNGGEIRAITDLYVAIDCKDASEEYFGGVLFRGLSAGHYPMSPLLLGADPLTMNMGYRCEVNTFPDFCCGRVYIPPGATNVLGSVICGVPNECYYPL